MDLNENVEGKTKTKMPSVNGKKTHSRRTSVVSEKQTRPKVFKANLGLEMSIHFNVRVTRSLECLDYKKSKGGMEGRWFPGEEYIRFLQRTCGYFPTPRLSGSQEPATPAPGIPKPLASTGNYTPV